MLNRRIGSGPESYRLTTIGTVGTLFPPVKVANLAPHLLKIVIPPARMTISWFKTNLSNYRLC
ncbi:Uncharacterised protein [Pseudomonas aeruginosa]|nr:Uncharacterised protein [Pseudomonas aeruginosa]